MPLIKAYASALFVFCSLIIPIGLLSSGCCCVTSEPVTVNKPAPSSPKLPEHVVILKVPYSAEEKWRPLTDSERYFWRFSYDNPSSTVNPPETFDPLVMNLEVSENTAIDKVDESDLLKNDVEYSKPAQKNVTETDSEEHDLDKIKAKSKREELKFKKLESEELKRLAYRDAIKAVKNNGGNYPWH